MGSDFEIIINEMANGMLNNEGERHYQNIFVMIKRNYMKVI